LSNVIFLNVHIFKSMHYLQQIQETNLESVFLYYMKIRILIKLYYYYYYYYSEGNSQQNRKQIGIL